MRDAMLDSYEGQAKKKWIDFWKKKKIHFAKMSIF